MRQQRVQRSSNKRRRRSIDEAPTTHAGTRPATASADEVVARIDRLLGEPAKP